MDRQTQKRRSRSHRRQKKQHTDHLLNSSWGYCYAEVERSARRVLQRVTRHQRHPDGLHRLSCGAVGHRQRRSAIIPCSLVECGWYLMY